jgi:alkanesulfonate monooxygenase SsuD/methylene tetrahydromethanopterin reductase-like flavin-dependent oxidoreductase (luciferase family)
MNERDFPGKTKVTFGIRVPNSGPLASPESIVQVAREAESLGYDSIWVHDHLNWDSGDMSFFEVMLARKYVGFGHFRNWH